MQFCSLWEVSLSYAARRNFLFKNYMTCCCVDGSTVQSYCWLNVNRNYDSLNKNCDETDDV